MRIDPNAKYPLPDPNKLHRLLASESDPATAAIIRLAWQAGLTATEIANLRWADINYDDGTLAVSNRIIPASADLIAFLSSMEREGRYVIYSNLAKGGPSTRNSVSHKARLALDRVGEQASLLDLRFDYIVQMLKEQPAEVVSRTTGCGVRTLQEINKRYTNGNPNPTPRRIRKHNLYTVDKGSLEAALEKEENPLDIKIIMLSWVCGLSIQEMSDLTWNNINLLDNVLSLSSKEIPLPDKLVSLFSIDKNDSQDSDYVLKGTRSAEKIATSFLSRRAAAFFARHNLGGLTLNGIRGKYNTHSESELKKIMLEMAKQNGYAAPSEVALQLNIGYETSSRLLHSLVLSGNLKYSWSRYIPVECQSRWDKFNDAIETSLDPQANVTRADLSATTGFASSTLYYYIKQAVKRGILKEICPGVYHYTGNE